MIYDVAIAGAGPAGLMAAKTSAEQGLKVVLIEKQKDISKVNRACCMQFIMDEDYESESIQVQNDKVVFQNNGFEVDYAGPLVPMTDKYFISPNGHKIHFAYPDKRPIIIKFDKGRLLKGLLNKCEQMGVEFIGGALAFAASDNGNGVTVKIKSKGRPSAIRAKKLIAADGANARIAETLGLNQERTYFATGLALNYYIENLKDFDSTTWKSYFGQIYQSKSPVMIAASLLGRDVASVLVIGSKNDPPKTIFNNVKTKSPLAYMFEQTTIVDVLACSVKAYTSLNVPYRGNSLVIGDAAAYVEVEVQGALMCGYRAGTAVARELAGEKGFEEYTRWWSRSFEFNSDKYLRVAQGFALVPTYTDAELDYLFTLIEDEVLEGTYNQYKSPKLIWDAILKHESVIAREQPELYVKIKTKKLTLSDVM
ncbi:NAD(P)/FAD-dependent oxidoreductase [bacterium]|nr:NAD(P)/FAD-dependent oxidoreductase [bacterium]